MYAEWGDVPLAGEFEGLKFWVALRGRWGAGALVDGLEDPALVEPEPGVGMSLDFFIEEGHDFACEAA